MTDTITSDSGVKYDISIGVCEHIFDNQSCSHPHITSCSKCGVQNREIKQESSTKTESEKQDFGKKLLQFTNDNISGDIENIKKLENFLSSNGYL